MEVRVLRRVLEKNDRAADEVRELLSAHGVRAINLLGGAGCGKTALLERLLPILRPALRCGVLEGDLATTLDAERIAAIGVPVTQLLTEGGCHLTAPHVRRALDSLPLDKRDLVISENVGNPICPANFDLGEHARLAALSVAEGADKPQKYPLLFKDAAGVVITKLDLLPHVSFDLHRVTLDLGRLNPAARLFLTSAERGHGLAGLAAWFRGMARGNDDATGPRGGRAILN
ncbi:MAG: hydrogenase nickel incorporation protein HypB [Phycisphaerae bacterium]